MKISAGIELLPGSNEILVLENNKTGHIKIENQLMQILILLAGSIGILVEKKTFIDMIWDGNDHSGSTALTKNIFRLREILKANGLEEKLMIETIPKKGYRLLLQESTKVEKKSSGYKKIFAVASVVLVAAILLLANMNRPVSKPAVTIIGNDTVIHLGDKKVQVIDTTKLR